MAENTELALVLKLVGDQFREELRKQQGALSSFNNFLKDWRTQLTAAGAALFAIAKSTANFGEEALKGAQKTGQTVQTFSALSHAAKMADLDNQQLITGLKTLSQNMVEAQRQTGDGEAALRRLGVSALDSSGKLRPTEAVLLDLAEVFAQSADGAGKTEAAVKLFGKAGIDLIPFLNMGRGGITALMAEAQRLGLVMSQEDAEAANKFNDELKKLDAQVKGLTVSIGLPLVRGLTDVLQMFQEVEASVKRAGAEMAGFSKMLSENFGKTGGGQLGMDVFSAVGFGHRKGEAPGAAEQALVNALGIKPGGPDGGRDVQMSTTVQGTTKPPIPEAKDQQKLAKDLLEIWLAGNRALDIRNKLMQEAAAGANEYFLAFDRVQQREKEDQDEQKRQGQSIVEQTQLEVQIREAAQQRERDGLIKNVQAWIDYDNQVGASTQVRYDRQISLLQATLAKETQLTQEESARLLMAWQNHDTQLANEVLNRTQLVGQERETLERQYLTRSAALNQQYAGTIWDGWRRGLEDYVRNTDSAFGFSAQMAQRTAQFMEQNFRTFFFDVMDERVKSLKDLFQGFSNFVKQIVAQIVAQLAVALALRGLTSAFGGGGALFGLFGGMGGRDVSGIDVGAMKFASGGMVLGVGNQDTVRALLSPGEGVLNRQGMQALAQLNAGGMPAASEPNITVVLQNFGTTTAPQVNFRRQMRGIIIDIINRDQDLRMMLAGR